MLNGVFALLERSLRIDVRSRSTHLIRFGLMISIYAALYIAVAMQARFGAPGLRFFEWMAYLDAAFLTLLGIGFLSSVITEEKEEGTLGLILMAGISPLGILLGKSINRLLHAMLLIAIQYPLMLLAVTMGGVTPLQAWAVLVALLAYVFLLAGLGLLSSTIASNSRSAAFFMTLGLCIFFLVAFGANSLSLIHARGAIGGSATVSGPDLLHLPDFLWKAIADVGRTNVFLEMDEILTTQYNESTVTIQVISNSLVGAVGLGRSWLVFGIATTRPDSEAISRGLVARGRWRLFSAPGRVWANPFVWKDFYFVAGGTAAIFMRAAYYVTLGIGLHELKSGPGSWIADYLVFMSLSIAIDIGWAFSRSMGDEVRGQMLPSLMLLPRSSIATVYSKFAGSLLGCLPGPLILALVYCCYETGREIFWSVVTNEYPVMWMFVAFLVLVPHMAALAALYVRSGAVAIGFAVSFFIFFLLLLRTFPGDPETIRYLSMRHALFMLSVAGACHLGIHLQVQRLGSQ